MKLERTFLLAFTLFLGCGSSVEQSVRALAPQGGTGMKCYRYATGEKMIDQEWQSFRIVRSTYYLKSGRELFDSKHDGSGYIALKLNEDESVIEISECRNFQKDGLSFEFTDNRLSKICRFRSGALVTEHPVGHK